MKNILGLFVCLLLFACHPSPKNETEYDTSSGINSSTTKANHHQVSDAGVIILQPFDGFPKDKLHWISARLKREGLRPLIRPAASLPKQAKVLYGSGYRYRADTLLEYLASVSPNDELILGLTLQDISYTKSKAQPDYGIMGLGSSRLGSAVVSSKRIKKHNLWDKMVKLCLHEIGHMKGLSHCDAPACLMRDAEGKDHLDDLKGFCSSCRIAWTGD